MISEKQKTAHTTAAKIVFAAVFLNKIKITHLHILRKGIILK